MAEYTNVPDVLALIVCDQIITDRLTGKQSLIGMFTNVQSWRFPVMHPHLSVYVALTEGRGKTPLTIRITDSDDARRPVVEGTGTVEFKNPRAIANLALNFQGLTFPEPGEYRVQILCQDTVLRDSRLSLVKVDPPKRPPGQGKPGVG